MEQEVFLTNPHGTLRSLKEHIQMHFSESAKIMLCEYICISKIDPDKLNLQMFSQAKKQGKLSVRI